jgi:hypothetical protein
VLQVVRPEQRQIVAKLPAGRIYSSGRGLVPAIRQSLYGKLAEAWRGEIGNGQPPSRAAAAENRAPTVTGTRAAAAKTVEASPRLPASWDDIGIGDLVIAQDDDPGQGWWRAIVMQQAGDTLTLGWYGFPRQKKILRHRSSLALLYPNDTSEAAAKVAVRAARTPLSRAAQQEPASAEPPNRYPKGWDDIGVSAVALAMEEMPTTPAFWEVVVIEQDGDVFTLRWRDYPEVPILVRHRLSLTLLCPTPMAAAAQTG